MTPAEDLCRLVYISRNLLRGSAADIDAEVDSILSVSRANNAAARLTGALLFNAECFAQILEGGTDSVQDTFERIQCDHRHRDTVILKSGKIVRRQFGEWSMAYAGRVDNDRLRFAGLTADADKVDRSETASEILTLMRSVILRAEKV